MPSGVRMNGLKVIRTQHDDDERERRMHFDLLRKPDQPIATR
jgi:hypothetical protein